MMNLLVAIMTYHQRFSALCNHNYFPRLFSFQIFYLVYMMHFIFPVFSLITTQFTAIRFQSAVDCSSPFCNNGNDGRYHIVTTFSINLIKFCELTYFPACFSFIGNTPAFCTNPVFVINF